MNQIFWKFIHAPCVSTIAILYQSWWISETALLVSGELFVGLSSHFERRTLLCWSMQDFALTFEFDSDMHNLCTPQGHQRFMHFFMLYFVCMCVCVSHVYMHQCMCVGGGGSHVYRWQLHLMVCVCTCMCGRGKGVVCICVCVCWGWGGEGDSTVDRSVTVSCSWNSLLECQVVLTVVKLKMNRKLLLQATDC